MPKNMESLLLGNVLLYVQPASAGASTGAAVVQKLVSSQASVIQLYRYPGLSESALKTLLKKVRSRSHGYLADQHCQRFCLSRVHQRPWCVCVCLTCVMKSWESAVLCPTQAQRKVTDAITGIDAEQCFNVAVDSPLTQKEAETMAW
jgi:hypothetical protein